VFVERGESGVCALDEQEGDDVCAVGLDRLVKGVPTAVSNLVEQVVISLLHGSVEVVLVLNRWLFPQ
jgi:hypothetical protein